MIDPRWLADSPIFAPGYETIWERYAALASRETYRKNTVVFEAGEPADRFFYLISGRVKVYVARPDGQERILSISEWGNTVGTSSCFDASLRYVSCATLAETTVLAFKRDAVIAAMATDSELTAVVLSSLARKQRGLTLQAHAAALRSTSSRVALLLCHLAAAYGTASEPNGETQLKIRMSTESLASVLGVARATLSRELSRLVRDGIIRKRKWELVVLDYDELRRRADADSPAARGDSRR
jgi:CRP-like cAMP-binding protein